MDQLQVFFLDEGKLLLLKQVINKRLETGRILKLHGMGQIKPALFIQVFKARRYFPRNMDAMTSFGRKKPLCFVSTN